MSDNSNTADALKSPVATSENHERDTEPTPRLATPATETTEDSVELEREAVGDEPDVGGLTPSDDAQ